MGRIKIIVEKIRRRQGNFTCDQCLRRATNFVKDPNNTLYGQFPTLYRAPGFHYLCNNHYNYKDYVK